jgi:hypothetical protein
MERNDDMAGIRPGQAKGPWVGSVIDTTEVTGALNVGTGTGLSFINRVGHDLVFRSIKQGANITVTNNALDITIAATVPFTAIANVGTGTGLVWRDTIAGTVNLKTIKQGTNITVTNNADDITIAATVAFTAIANVGTGTGTVWRDTIAGTINLKTIKQGAGITVTNNADDITVTCTITQGIIAVANVGTGQGNVWRDTIAGTANLKTIKQGTGITVTNNADDVTVTCTVTGESTTVVNVGTGTGLVYKSMTGAQINLKSIKQGTNVTVTNNADDITIAATVAFTAIANVGTGTGLVWRDTIAGTINLKSIKQGTGITVTNNADDITVACTITQGPTGSGTIGYLAYWSAGTVLGTSPLYTSGNDIFMADNYDYRAGNTIAAATLRMYAFGGLNGTSVVTGTGLLRVRGESSLTPDIPEITFGPNLITINYNNANIDVTVKGAGASPEVLHTDASDYRLEIPARLAINGVIDNAGSPLAGGSSGAPTAINLAAAGNPGTVIRIGPASEANRFYKLTNPTNYQVVIVHNESIYNAVIYAESGGPTYPFILVPPLHVASGTGNFAILQFNPNAFTGGGGWMQLDVQRQPISAALTDAATIAVDASYGDCLLTVTLGGNRTLGGPTNPVHDGQKIVFKVSQDGTGNRTLAYDALYRFSTDLPSPTLSTAASKIDYLGFIYNAASNKWDFVGKVFGFN